MQVPLEATRSGASVESMPSFFSWGGRALALGGNWGTRMQPCDTPQPHTQAQGTFQSGVTQGMRPGLSLACVPPPPLCHTHARMKARGCEALHLLLCRPGRAWRHVPTDTSSLRPSPSTPGDEQVLWVLLQPSSGFEASVLTAPVHKPASRLRVKTQPSPSFWDPQSPTCHAATGLARLQ